MIELKIQEYELQQQKFVLYENSLLFKREEPAATITGSRIGSGAPMVADVRLNERKKRYPRLYKIIPWDDAVSTIIGQTDIQCGALSVADARLPNKPRAGTYGIMKWNEAAKTVVGNADVHAGCAAVSDPRIPKENEQGVWVIVSIDRTWLDTYMDKANRSDSMKVIIMKCSKQGAWWNKSIGKIFDVLKELEEDYLIKVKDTKKEGNHILKSDCEVI